jgi:hypothetical protein
MSLPADILHVRSHPLWDTRRLWSLADMINFALSPFIHGREMLLHELLQTKEKAASDPHEIVPESVAKLIDGTVKHVIKECVEKGCLDVGTSGIDLDVLVTYWSINKYTWSSLHFAMDRLWRDMESCISSQYFFHYDSECAAAISPSGIDFTGAQSSKRFHQCNCSRGWR